MRAALARLFGDQDRWSAMIAPMLRHQVALLGREAVVAVQVGAADFPDAAALDALGSTALRIAVDQDLPPAPAASTAGWDSSIGVGAQWAALAALLDDMAGQEAGRC